jgi:hypothetical protein
VNPLAPRLALGVLLIAMAASPPAHAYSYAAAGAEPLLDGREALLSAVSTGNWSAADAALASLKPELTYLDQNEDAGVSAAFASALQAKNQKAVRDALLRASIDEIRRRLAGGRQNLTNYQTAKILVVKAERFYTAIAGDLPPDRRQPVEDGLRKALDAVGNPGVFGVGAHSPDPAAYDQATQKVLEALGNIKGSS